MMQPLDEARFSHLSLDYITSLGKEIFFEDHNTHRKNTEKSRRLCYLITMKAPKFNAAQFYPTGAAQNPQDLEVELKCLNDMVLGMMYEQQMRGQLDALRVDQAVWHRLAA
jgi:hypothetical protein